MTQINNMTEEKCYSLERDGTYCLGFPNKFALSEEEIREIFSEFGTVISVRVSGDERGFRFVRYRSLEEAESAIEGLKGNKKIRILPKKPRVQSSNDKGSPKDYQKNDQQRDNIKRDNPNRKKDEEDDFNDAFKTDENSVSHSRFGKSNSPKAISTAVKENLNGALIEEISIDVEKKNLLQFLKLRSTRGTVATNFGSNITSNLVESNNSKPSASMGIVRQSRSNQYQEKSNKDDTKLDEPAVSKSPNWNQDRKASENDDHKLLQKTRRGKQHRVNHSTSNIANESTSKPQESPIIKNSSNHDEPPELVTTDELKHRSLKGSVCSDESKMAMAEEVIVANIHEKFSVLYILYLLEKFEPICVTEMKTISKNGLRYCSVYFQSQKDAIAVEKKFDNFNLSGNRLIVRTPELLINEVAVA